MNKKGQNLKIILLIGIMLGCAAIAEAGDLDFTPSDDLKPMGYEGITSFEAASPNSSDNATILGAPATTTQTWNMPTPMPMGQPMESKLTVTTTNEDGILSADINIDSDLDGPIGGKGNIHLKPELDTHDFSTKLEGDSEADATFRTLDKDKAKDYDPFKSTMEGLPRNLDEAKDFKQPERPEEHVPIYSHDLATDTYISPRKFDSHTSGKDEDTLSSPDGYMHTTPSHGSSPGSGYTFDQDPWQNPITQNYILEPGSVGGYSSSTGGMAGLDKEGASASKGGRKGGKSTEEGSIGGGGGPGGKESDLGETEGISDDFFAGYMNLKGAI